MFPTAGPVSRLGRDDEWPRARASGIARAMLRHPHEILRTVFGFPAFRGVQEAVIADVCAGRDVALVMPTGAGKSLCYQVPAIAREGCGIVISPLIALMDDQVEALSALGVRAAAAHSGNARAGEAIAAFRRGALDLLYVAPERAVTAAFAELAIAGRVALLAIDEAHCVSQWGHDFRPEYRQLRALADRLPGVPRLALTATADATTRADICAQLGIAPDALVVAGFDRPNIRYAAKPRKEAAGQLRSFLADHRGEAGIVYCDTRRGADETADLLRGAGVPARSYHAGMEPEDRARAQQWFRRAEDGVMAATIAFGMGIDKPDVRFVVHMGLPKSIEAYYQETGRAGRDGAPADALLLWHEADVVRARRRIDEGDAGEDRRRHERGQLDRLVAWAGTTGCRRLPLLAHFGELRSEPCGNCDNCAAPPATRDATEAARKLLSAVVRTGQRFGLGHVAAVLRGEADERTERLGHDRLSVFGIGRDLPAAHWQRLGRHLEALGALVRDPDHGGLALTPRARPILTGDEPVAVRADLLEREARRRRTVRAPVGDPAASGRLERLKAWRRQAAAAAGVPAYVIFHDSTLQAIAEAAPDSPEGLAGIPGIGAAKLARHGDAVLRVLRDETAFRARR
jgi:ATP-dependent DNA helicase RecQ